MVSSTRKKHLTSVLKQYALRLYNVQAYHSLYRKEAAYRVSTDKGTFCLKPFRGSFARLSGIHKRLDDIRSSNFSSLPRWIPRKNGKYWSPQDGQFFYVTEWINGTKLGDKENDFLRLGAILARLHQSTTFSKSVSPSYTLREINRFRRMHQLFTSRLEKLNSEKRELWEWFQEHGADCLSLAEESWNVINQGSIQRILEEEKPSIIHGDVTRPNVIVQSANVFLIDWELARPGSTYYEVAKTLANVTNFSVPLTKAFLSGYESVRPLSYEEWQLIVSLTRLPREAWIAARQILSGRPSVTFHVLKVTWGRRMEWVGWLDSWANLGSSRMSISISDPDQGMDADVVSLSN